MLTKKAGAAEGSYGVRTEEQHWPLETGCHGETASAALVYLLGTGQVKSEVLWNSSRPTQRGNSVREQGLWAPVGVAPRALPGSQLPAL